MLELTEQNFNDARAVRRFPLPIVKLVIFQKCTPDLPIHVWAEWGGFQTFRSSFVHVLDRQYSTRYGADAKQWELTHRQIPGGVPSRGVACAAEAWVKTTVPVGY